MIEKRDFYIDGKWVAPRAPNDCDVIDPATEEACAVISLGAKADVDAAVAAARRAFPAWAATLSCSLMARASATLPFSSLSSCFQPLKGWLLLWRRRLALPRRTTSLSVV